MTTKFGAEANPLRRRSDRIESAALVTAVLLCVAALPVAILVGISVRGELLNVAERQAQTRLSALGTVLDEPTPAAGTPAYPLTARVVWTMPNGLETVGSVIVPNDARRGSRVPVWTTSQGLPTSPPLTPSHVTAIAAAVGVSLEATATCFVWMALLVVRRALDQRRYRDWESEWMQMDPGQHS